MTDRNIGLEILDGIKEIKAFKEGKADLITRVLSERRVQKPHPNSFNLNSSYLSISDRIQTTLPSGGNLRVGSS